MVHCCDEDDSLGGGGGLNFLTQGPDKKDPKNIKIILAGKTTYGRSRATPSNSDLRRV